MQNQANDKILDREFLIISSDLKELKKIEEFSQHISQKATLTEEQSDNMAIVLTELVHNAIVHGNKMISDKKVILRANYYPDRVSVSIKDEGAGFDPSMISNPTNPENLWKESGRGIFLVKNLIDEVHFRPSHHGMEIVVTEYYKNVH